VRDAEGIYLKDGTRGWHDNIKVHTKEKSCEDRKWNNLAHEHI
jgi:hypothetical protein